MNRIIPSWLCIVIAMLLTVTLGAQSTFFESVSLDAITAGFREIEPERARYFRADTLALRQLLFNAPQELDLLLLASPAQLQVPGPDGVLRTFQLLRYPMLEPGLSEKFPGITNLYGREIGKGERQIRLDWTYNGFHALVRGGPEGTWYVDPIYTGDRLHYQVYAREALTPPTQRPVCGVSDTPDHPGIATAPAKYGDCSFRSYRLAVATTGEYYVNQGNNTAAVLSTINTTVSRVNDVMEPDLAIRLVLVADNDLILYSDTNTDPYDDTDAGQMVVTNTGVINAAIGENDYDFGHVFSWSGGGLAQLRSVCNANAKGAGTTSRSGLTGDAFYIDYVAHEFGHQMGAPHTFNAAGDGNCTVGSRSASNSFEPGSGSTIMAYAGICSGANVQLNSDAYFHVGSLTDIANFMELGDGAGCATTINVNNSAPVVSAGADQTLPANTPFVLTATGSDADGDPLRYTWEQHDAMGTGYSGPPTGGETTGPLFRSLPPASSPTRYFPNLSDLTAGNSPAWEVLPTVARSLTFRVTARDGAAGFGCTVLDEVDLTVVNSTGFAVTQPAGGESWPAESTQTVTWDVAGTGPGTAVDCATVDILLSTDGGASYGTVLASSVPNDGSHPVTLPTSVGMTNRIQVRSSDNVFFNISPQNFTISAQTFVLNTTSPEITFCSDEPVQLPLTVQSLESYAGSVSLSVSNGLPGGASATFTTNPVTVGVGETRTTTLELSNVPAGDYTIEVTGTDGFTQRVLSFDITVKQGVRAVTLSAPENEAVVNPATANFSWTADDEATSYGWFFYESIGQSSVLGFAVSNPTVSPDLSGLNDGNYFWRVGVLDSACDMEYGNFSSYRAVTISRTQLSSSAPTLTVCAGGATSVAYPIALAAGGTLTGTVSFAASGLPGGVSASFDPATLNDSGSTQLTLSGVAGLAAGDYSFQVSGSDADDSETLNLLLSIAPAPAAVAAVTPADGSFQTDRVLPLEWTADPGADEYDLVLSTNSDLSSPFITNTLPGRSTTITFTGFSDGTTVYWQVTSRGICGSAASSPVFTFTFGSAPLPVTWLAFSASAMPTYTQLSWRVEELGDNLGFVVERSNDGREFTDLGWVPATDSAGTVSYAYPDREARPGERYFYRLRQLDLDGQFSFSPIREVRLPGKQLRIELRPNPARETTLLEIPDGTVSGRYAIFDAYGRTLLNGEVRDSPQRIDLGKLPPGLYYLRYRAEGRSTVQRLIKQ